MAGNERIVQLHKDKAHTIKEYPITVTEAVKTANGKTLAQEWETEQTARTTTFNASEASRASTFASKEAERDAATATISQEASKLTALESKVDSNVLAVEFDETDGSLVMITGEDSAFSASDSYINEETGEVVMVYNF